MVYLYTIPDSYKIHSLDTTSLIFLKASFPIRYLLQELEKIFIVDIFMWSLENICAKGCPHGLIPVFYRRYADDKFILVLPFDHEEKFKEYLSSRNTNINYRIFQWSFESQNCK